MAKLVEIVEHYWSCENEKCKRKHKTQVAAENCEQIGKKNKSNNAEKLEKNLDLVCDILTGCSYTTAAQRYGYSKNYVPALFRQTIRSVLRYSGYQWRTCCEISFDSLKENRKRASFLLDAIKECRGKAYSRKRIPGYYSNDLGRMVWTENEKSPSQS